MDPATLIGLALAFGALFAMITLEHASFAALLLPAPMILVFGATIAVTIASSTLGDALAAAKALPKALLGKKTKLSATVATMADLSRRAAAEGIMALEHEAHTTKDPFLRDALAAVADSDDTDSLRELLEDRIDSKRKADAVAAKFFSDMGGYAPTIGIVGTVISMTHIMENLSQPDTLGPLIATAFVATLWGLLTANFMWLPLAHRLRRLSAIEVADLTLKMEGALQIMEGEKAIVVTERLQAMVPGHKESKKAAA